MKLVGVEYTFDTTKYYFILPLTEEWISGSW